MRAGETRRVECPHCHLETIIFNKSNESGKVAPPEKILKSSKIELFLFELTRFPTVAGAVLVLLAFVVTAVLVVQTRLPEKPPKLPIISYEMVAPAPAITPNVPSNEGVFIPQGAKIASKNMFPQPVVDFLLKHQGFTLKEWLNHLNPEQKQAFLKNLAAVIVTANSQNLNGERIEQVVKDFAELWITMLSDDVAARAKDAIDKQVRFSQLTTEAFGLFISLMTLCLILVLLAIERNTRTNAKPRES